MFNNSHYCLIWSDLVIEVALQSCWQISSDKCDWEILTWACQHWCLSDGVMLLTCVLKFWHILCWRRCSPLCDFLVTSLSNARNDTSHHSGLDLISLVCLLSRRYCLRALMVLSAVISRKLDTVLESSFRILNFLLKHPGAIRKDSQRVILQIYWIIGFFKNVFAFKGPFDEKGLSACDFG